MLEEFAVLKAALFASLLLVVPLANASAQFGFNLYRSGVDISGDDLELVRESVRAVMASNTVGTIEDWSNPASGMSGETTLLELYRDENYDGQCGQVLILVHQGDREAPFNLRLCQRPDGTWGIAG